MDSKTKYERNLEWAKENDMIVYYDYISYKKAAGWYTGLIGTDWKRPEKIQRAKYNSEFLQNLPEYYFLGLSINELLKSSYANGRCHACAIALSLYFNDFEIITCNLKNYAEHYTIKSKNSIYDYSEIDEFEHTFLVVDLDVKKIVIDTTWGFITEFSTYEKIFAPNKIRTITSKQLKGIEVYQYIKSLKEYKLDLNCFREIYIEEENKWIKSDGEIEFKKIQGKYLDLCKSYKNDDNFHLQDFINRCLFRTSNNTCHWDWRCTLESRYNIEYPKNNMFSLEDDEFDNRIESELPETIERNKKVLENYHKEPVQESESKVKKLKKRILKYFNK